MKGLAREKKITKTKMNNKSVLEEMVRPNRERLFDMHGLNEKERKSLDLVCNVIDARAMELGMQWRNTFRNLLK